MSQTINSIMTHDLVSVSPDTSVSDAAALMRQHDTGDVLVTQGDSLNGILTDRDIVVRAIAEGRDPTSTSVSEICSTGVSTLSSDQSLEDAVSLMREQNVRRVPVVDDGRPVGVITIGDLAQERDSKSALAEISAAPANH